MINCVHEWSLAARCKHCGMLRAAFLKELELSDQLAAANARADQARRDALEEAAKMAERRAEKIAGSNSNGYFEGDTNAFIWTNKEAEWECIVLEEFAESIRALINAAPSAAAQPQDSRETGWLIEHGEKKGPMYFCGWRNGNQYTPVWDADNNKAIRFCREQDAAVVMLAIGGQRKVVEHMWINAAPQESVSASADMGSAPHDQPASAAPDTAAVVTDEMVSRFLTWPLPKSFAPDCGISFDKRPPDARGYIPTWPVGTNLFTATEARQMLEHVLNTATVEPDPSGRGKGEPGEIQRQSGTTPPPGVPDAPPYLSYLDLRSIAEQLRAGWLAANEDAAFARRMLADIVKSRNERAERAEAECARLREALVCHNDNARSFFQIANRIATELGTHALQTNFGGFAETTKRMLEKYHQITNEARDALINAAPQERVDGKTESDGKDAPEGAAPN